MATGPIRALPRRTGAAVPRSVGAGLARPRRTSGGPGLRLRGIDAATPRAHAGGGDGRSGPLGRDAGPERSACRRGRAIRARRHRGVRKDRIGRGVRERVAAVGGRPRDAVPATGVDAQAGRTAGGADALEQRPRLAHHGARKSPANHGTPQRWAATSASIRCASPSGTPNCSPASGSQNSTSANRSTCTACPAPRRSWSGSRARC